MPWIESHQSLARHPKMIRLSGLLKVSKAATIGHLHLFWWWALDYAPGGSLESFTDLEIASGADWTKAPEMFVKALTDAGWIDPDRHVHDWDQYMGKYASRKEVNAKRMRDKRAESSGRKQRTASPDANHVQRTCSARAAHVQDRVDARVGLPTNQEEQEEQPTNQPRGQTPSLPEEESLQNPVPDPEASLPVELPPGFPRTSQEAVAACFGQYPEPWILEVYHRALGRGGRDSRDVPIRVWSSHVASMAKYARTVDPEKTENAGGRPESSGQRVFRLTSLVRELEKAMAEHKGRPGAPVSASVAAAHALDYKALRGRWVAARKELQELPVEGMRCVDQPATGRDDLQVPSEGGE